MPKVVFKITLNLNHPSIHPSMPELFYTDNFSSRLKPRLAARITVSTNIDVYIYRWQCQYCVTKKREKSTMTDWLSLCGFNDLLVYIVLRSRFTTSKSFSDTERSAMKSMTARINSWPHITNREWVSEWIVNRTSAQSGYTVPFMSVHTEKYKTEDKLKIQTIHKLTQPRKETGCKTQQNKTTLVQSLLATLDQEMRWTYSTTLFDTTEQETHFNSLSLQLSHAFTRMQACEYRYHVTMKWLPATNHFKKL